MITARNEAHTKRRIARKHATKCLLPLNATLLHTGTLVLTRGDDGLITKYREIWDVTVAESLKTVYL